MPELVLDGVVGLHDLVAARDPGQRLGQPVIGLRSDDEIDDRCAVDDLLALGLGDATGHGHAHLHAPLGLFGLQQLDAAQFGIDLLGGPFADMAGVEQNEIGVLDHFGRLVAIARQGIAHTLRIVDVHLAAIGLDEDLAGIDAGLVRSCCCGRVGHAPF